MLKKIGICTLGWAGLYGLISITDLDTFAKEDFLDLLHASVSTVVSINTMKDFKLDTGFRKFISYEKNKGVDNFLYFSAGFFTSDTINIIVELLCGRRPYLW